MVWNAISFSKSVARLLTECGGILAVERSRMPANEARWVLHLELTTETTRVECIGTPNYANKMPTRLCTELTFRPSASLMLQCTHILDYFLVATCAVVGASLVAAHCSQVCLNKRARLSRGQHLP